MKPNPFSIALFLFAFLGFQPAVDAQDTSKVYQHYEVDAEAQFEGGENKMFDWLITHMKYPDLGDSIESYPWMKVSFIVHADGNFTDVTITSKDRKIPELEVACREAMATTKGKWVPAKKDDKIVTSRKFIDLKIFTPKEVEEMSKRVDFSQENVVGDSFTLTRTKEIIRENTLKGQKLDLVDPNGKTLILEPMDLTRLAYFHQGEDSMYDFLKERLTLPEAYKKKYRTRVRLMVDNDGSIDEVVYLNSKPFMKKFEEECTAAIMEMNGLWMPGTYVGNGFVRSYYYISLNNIRKK